MSSNSKSARKKKAGNPTEYTRSTPDDLIINHVSRKKSLTDSHSQLSARPSSQNWSVLSLMGRFLVWCTLYMMLFQCPAVPDSSSSTICHVYSKFSHTLAPHIQPYYEAYALPYFDKITPYVYHYNNAYIYPAFEIAAVKYEKYAQPSIQKARTITDSKYYEKLHSYVYRGLTGLNNLFAQHVAPYSSMVSRFCQDIASSPFWEQLWYHVEGVYDTYFTPAIRKASPYLDRVYESSRHATITVLDPYVRHGARVGVEWFDRHIWNFIRDIWKDYVEVQVYRIKESVNTGNEHFESGSETNSSFISNPRNYGPRVDISLEEDTPERESAREAARKQIEGDLAFYAEKFDKHANEAIESLNARVDQIIVTAISEKKPTVEQQMKKLDAMIDHELRSLKSTIINLARNYNPGSSEEGRTRNKLNTFDKLFQATSTVGKLVKETVQEMRWDSQEFLARVFDEVAVEADIRIEKVDSFIESGIQELGMKWAWEVDGMAYKDWARYQDLKKEFSGIKLKVIQAAERNKKLAEIANWVEGEAWEGGANLRAKEVANELGRLRRIAKKKIELADYSEDFSDTYLTAEFPEIDEVIYADTNQGTAASHRTTGVIMVEAHAIVDEQRAKIHTGNMLEDTVVEKIRDPRDNLQKIIKGAVDFVKVNAEERAEEVMSAAQGGYEAASSVVTSMLTPPPAVENILSSASQKLDGIVADARRNVYGSEEGITEMAISTIDEVYDTTANQVSKAIYERETGTHDFALSMMSEVAQSASAEISIAIYGTSKSPAGKATSVIARHMQAATRILGEQHQEAESAVVEAFHGKEEDEYYARLFESAQTKLVIAVESARATLEEIYERSKTAASENVGKKAEVAKSAVNEIMSSASKEIKKKHQKPKDEL